MTVSATVVVDVRVPEVPVMVTVAFPRVAVLEALTVSVLLENEAVTPEGRPVAE